MKASLLLASLVTILIIPTEVKSRIEMGRFKPGCYLRLYRVSHQQGSHYRDTNLGSDHEGLKVGRRKLKRFRVQSLSLNGDSNTCCFKLFSGSKFRGKRSMVYGGDKLDKINQ